MIYCMIMAELDYFVISYFFLASNGIIFEKRDLLAFDHIMLALFWSYVLDMK